MKRLKVCSVDFLNSAPLVWGLLHGPQRGLFDLTFRVPSLCADLVESGEVDIGNIPAIETARQNLEIVPGPGVACRGPVRSILLVSKRPLDQIRTLAADSSSRSSVALARIILARRYGVEPEFRAAAPDLPRMVALCDAALIIGDPALHIEPSTLPYLAADLGGEWVEMTGLPMVFAVWAGRAECLDDEIGEVFRASCRYGRERLEEVVRAESGPRRIEAGLARDYLSNHIVNELGEREYLGLELFLRYAREAGLVAESEKSLPCAR